MLHAQLADANEITHAAHADTADAGANRQQARFATSYLLQTFQGLHEIKMISANRRHPALASLSDGDMIALPIRPAVRDGRLVHAGHSLCLKRTIRSVDTWTDCEDLTRPSIPTGHQSIDRSMERASEQCNASVLVHSVRAQRMAFNS